jgi:uncharacterized repeat protein (TIGR01451 family)
MRLLNGIRLFAVSSAVAAVGMVGACKDATTVDVLQIDATGAIAGVAFLDNNGNSARDAGDAALPHVPVVLTAAHGSQVIDQAETDTTGVFVFTDVPVGGYRLDLGEGALGDSLEAVGQGTDVTVRRDSTVQVSFGASYPVLPLDEVRTAATGRKVFTSGIALNPRLNYGDGLVAVQADSFYLRAINVARANINVGDSVRLLGRVKMDQGQPVLDEVTPYILISAATVVIPKEVGTSDAASARDGRLDAALVRIRDAEISDTSTVSDAFHFFADDGSGRVEVVLRPFLQMNTAPIRPDTVVRISQLTGLLVPEQDLTSGTVHWRVYPRGGTDLNVENKIANVSVAVTADTSQASPGDPVEFTVVLTNINGPLAASRIEVTDTVPTGAAFVSYDATRGSYNPTTGIWALDSLAVGATDSLRIRVTVDAASGFITDQAVVKLFKELNSGRSFDLETVTIVP